MSQTLTGAVATIPVPMFTGDLAFLSNFDTTPFWMPLLGTTVKSGEHAFNALKALNWEARLKILNQPTPGLAKRAGRMTRLRSDWNTGARVAAMQCVLGAKFSHPGLRKLLLATQNLMLVETNTWHDNFWGDCLCGRPTPVCAEPGKNMLGELLMAERTKYRM